jgi:uncharacterized protein (TIGR03000 family)
MNALYFLTTARRPVVAAGLLAACCLAAGAGEPGAAPEAAAKAQAQITVVVPADAQVFFDGEPTTSTGTERLFLSPPLTVGKQYHYVVRARWQADGKPVEQTRKVPVTGGGSVRVDFTAPAPGEKGKEPGPAPAPTRAGGAGRSLSAKGWLLRRDKPEGDWQVVGDKEELKAGELLLGLPGAVIASKNDAVHMTLRTDIDSPLPVLEPAVVLHDDADYDLDFTLDRGRIDVVNAKKAGPARVRIRAWNSAWVATLDAPGSKLAVELLGRCRPGAPFTTTPGPRDVPVADMLFLVLAGDVALKHGTTQFGLSAPPGPAQIGWNNFVGMDPSPRRLDQLPAWAEIPKDEASQKRAKKLLAIRDKMVQGFSSKPVGEVLDELVASDDPVERLVGVVYIGATDDLTRMGKLIHESKRPDTWDNVVRVLRHWLGRAPGQDQRFYNGLLKVRDYKPVQAESLIEMLHGFKESELDRPELYEMLIDFLVDGRTSMRGMAHWHLIRLAPAGKDIPYDPNAPKAELEKARKEWKKIIPPGQLPPDRRKEVKP